MTSISTLKGIYDTRLIALSVFIAVLVAYAGTELAGRIVTSRGQARRLWCCGGSLALGIGIWATRYTVMEGVHFTVPVAYDWPTVLASLVASTFAAAIGLYAVSRPVTSFWRSVAGSSGVAFGFAVMQFQAVHAVRMQARLYFTLYGTVLFLLVAFAVSYLGIRITTALRDTSGQWSWNKCASLLLLGVSLPLMSLVGSAAVHFTRADTFNGSLRHAISLSSLDSVTVSMASLLVLGIVFLSSTVGRRFSQQAQQLLQSEAQLQAIFDNMQEGIVVVDRSMNVVQVNRAACRLFALTDKKITQPELRDALELFQPNGELLSLDQWPSALAFQGNFLQDHEIHSRRKVDGKQQVLEVSSAPIFNRAGEVTQIIVSYRDITRQKTLDLARARLVAIIESSEDAIIGKDGDGNVTSWNLGAEKIFGYTAEEIVGQSIRRLIPVDLEQEEDGILDQINSGVTVEHIETVRRRKDGELIHVSLTISPIRDASGNIIGASKIARDITERRLLERQLRQSHKMEAIGQLTGGIAHDFNNLLGVILGNLDLLATLVVDNEPALKRVITAQKAVTHGAELTRRMLMFSRKEDLRPRPSSLEESVRNMIELAGRGIGPEIRITPHFDPTVPLVFVDVAGLESALLNLVVNARDAMPKGGTVTITTQLSTLEENYP
ncbi:MAG: PAS domain S-box protein, partial [Acidobacteriota bacterium]